MPGIVLLAVVLGLAVPQTHHVRPVAGDVTMANGEALQGPGILGKWHVTEVRGATLPPEAKIDINFDGERVWGIAGCSGFNATAAVEGDLLRLGMISFGSTECEPEIMQAASDFIRAFGTAGRFEVGTDGRLTLYAAQIPVVVAER